MLWFPLYLILNQFILYSNLKVNTLSSIIVIIINFYLN